MSAVYSGTSAHTESVGQISSGVRKAGGDTTPAAEVREVWRTLTTGRGSQTLMAKDAFVT